METLFKQIQNKKYLPSGVHEEFSYTIWRDEKRLKELLWHLEKCEVKLRHLDLAKDLTKKLLQEYE